MLNIIDTMRQLPVTQTVFPNRVSKPRDVTLQDLVRQGLVGTFAQKLEKLCHTMCVLSIYRYMYLHTVCLALMYVCLNNHSMDVVTTGLPQRSHMCVDIVHIR